MIKVLIVHTTGRHDVVEIDPTLSELQTIVGGDIEYVPLTEGHAYCNESGKVRGMAWNERASRIARDCGWPLSGDALVGDVVFLGSTDNGEEADVPDSILLQL